MSFFADVDDMAIFERNSSRVEGLEMSQARKLLKQYEIAKEELKLQLLNSPSNTFTEAKLKDALRQMDQSIAILNKKIRPEIMAGFDYMTEQGADDSANEVNSMEKKFNGVSRFLPVDAIIESIDPENLLFNQYQSSIETYNETMRNDFQQILTQSLLQNKTWSQAVYDIESIFSDMAKWRVARIVRTELHGIYGNAKNNGFINIRDKYLPDLQKTLYVPRDGRTAEDSKHMATLDMVRNLDEPFSYTWKGQKRVFMSPPDRPNDRSILIPYRKSYGNI